MSEPDGRSELQNQAVIIVDHGSRRAASNQMLQDAVSAFAAQSKFRIVEPAHMELAQPDIATAFARCVERGADRVIVFPYFLSPGRHWDQDIPRLVREAAASFPGIPWLVTAPFALHPGLLSVISDRIQHCLAQSVLPAEAQQGCEVCTGDRPCLFK